MPCWKTTATNAVIEIWGSGFNGVPSYSGRNFAELNATQVSTLYQDFTAPLGSTVQISFAHRGRAGTDVMSVSIGPVGGPYVDLGNFSAGRAWVYHNINYTFPSAGPSNYTIRFNSISAAGGATVGNFLDAVSITYPMPTLSFDVINSSCISQQNGSIQAIVSGGTPPYSFSWAPPVVSTSSMASQLAPGIYSITVSDFYGCTVSNSATLSYDTLPPPFIINKIICQGQSYQTRKGVIVTQAGTYIDTLSGGDCDSVFIQNISIQNIGTDTLDAIICEGQYYTINNKSYSGTGIYSDTLQSSAGCDSVVIIKLRVIPSDTTFIRAVICQGDSFKYNSNSYTQTGRFNNLFQGISGCDSIVIVDLSVLTHSRDTTAAAICLGEVYSFEGNSYNTAGTYAATLTGSRGCDSVKVLILEVYNQYRDTISARICFGEQYNLPNGVAVSSGGTYTTSLNAGTGCDSVITTILEVLPSYQANLTDTICERQRYRLPDGNYVTGGGIYRINLQSSGGCDSVITVFLAVNNRPAWADLEIIPDDVEINRGDTLSLATRTNLTSPLTYTWQPAWGLSCYDCAAPMFYGMNSTDYQLFVSDSNGCGQSAQARIRVMTNYDVFIPNVFTPNADGANDLWQIFGTREEIKYLYVKVFNRWGEKVFESNDGYFTWDGTYKSEPQPPGVYVFYIDIVWMDNSSMTPVKGSVTLLK